MFCVYGVLRLSYISKGRKRYEKELERKTKAGKAEDARSLDFHINFYYERAKPRKISPDYSCPSVAKGFIEAIKRVAIAKDMKVMVINQETTKGRFIEYKEPKSGQKNRRKH